MKSRTYYVLNDIINIKNFDPNKIIIDEKSCKNIRNYYIGYVTIEDCKCVKINSVNRLYLIVGKMNGYFEEIDGYKYLTLVPNNESKNIMRKYKEL